MIVSALRDAGLKIFAVVTLLASCAYGQAPAPHYSLLDNLNEKLAAEKLTDAVVLGTPAKKAVPIVAGAEFLLKYLGADPQFKKDHIWGRFGASSSDDDHRLSRKGKPFHARGVFQIAGRLLKSRHAPGWKRPTEIISPPG